MITVPEIREALGWAAEKDAEVKGIRDAVVALWESGTGRLWDARTGRVEVVRPRTTRIRSIFLGLSPVTAITQVRVRYLLSESDWETLEAGDYLLIGDRQLYRTRTGFDHFRPSYVGWEPLVEVTYDGGAASADADIRNALKVQAKFMASRWTPEKILLHSVSTPEGGSTRYIDPDMHPHFKALMARNARVA